MNVYRSKEQSRIYGEPDSENIVEDVIYEFFKEQKWIAERYYEDNGKLPDPEFVSAKELYEKHPDYFKVPFIGSDMNYVFLNKENIGCNVFIKIPNPKEYGKGIHIGTRYYKPGKPSVIVYPNIRSGPKGSRYWTKYIKRTGSWKRRLKEEMKKGLEECYGRYTFKI